MILRTLPVSEWDRLPEDLGIAAQYFDRERSHVIVVEDQGQIVGQWAAIWLRHAEGVWIHPEYRRGAVARHLWKGMRDHVNQNGASAILTAASTPEIVAMLEKQGAQKVPQEYLLCL